MIQKNIVKETQQGLQTIQEFVNSEVLLSFITIFLQSTYIASTNFAFKRETTSS